MAVNPKKIFYIAICITCLSLFAWHTYKNIETNQNGTKTAMQKKMMKNSQMSQFWLKIIVKPAFNFTRLTEHGYNKDYPVWSYFEGKCANTTFIGWSGKFDKIGGNVMIIL